jgi:hypothetical protein
MQWVAIRAHYAACLAHKMRQGATQQDVARAGGLVARNAISKLLVNTAMGPTVETFTNAVEGLGLSVAEFFATLPPAVDPPSAPPCAPPAPRPGSGFAIRSAHDGHSSSGVAVPSSVSPRELVAFQEEVRAAMAVVTADLERLTKSMVDRGLADRAPRRPQRSARANPRRRNPKRA